MSNKTFRLTRAQASGLARALRAASWDSKIAGEFSVCYAHRDGTEVSITVTPHVEVKPMKEIKGFRNE